MHTYIIGRALQFFVAKLCVRSNEPRESCGEPNDSLHLRSNRALFLARYTGRDPPRQAIAHTTSEWKSMFIVVSRCRFRLLCRAGRARVS